MIVVVILVAVVTNCTRPKLTLQGEGSFIDENEDYKTMLTLKSANATNTILIFVFVCLFFVLQYTCLANEPFPLVTLHVVPPTRISKRCHVHTITGISPVLRFICVPVGVFNWAVVRPEERALHVYVVKTDPEVRLLLEQHRRQERLFVPVNIKWN